VNEWLILENHSNEECKLKLRNAINRGIPPFGRGGSRKLREKITAEESWTRKIQVHPPFLLGGAWNFFAGSIWKSGTMEITLGFKII